MQLSRGARGSPVRGRRPRTRRTRAGPSSSTGAAAAVTYTELAATGGLVGADREPASLPGAGDAVVLHLMRRFG